MRFPKTICILLLILLLIGCSAPQQPAQIAATTGPVAQFAAAIADGTGITVVQVISDSISCLHDYSLSVRQMEVLTGSRIVLISGAGLEESMEDVLETVDFTDCSVGVSMLEADGHAHEEHDHGHHHEHDPHIWLSPANAAIMAEIDNDEDHMFVSKSRVGTLVYSTVEGETKIDVKIIDNKIPMFLFNPPIYATSLIESNSNVHLNAYYTLQVFPLLSNEELYTNE